MTLAEIIHTGLENPDCSFFTGAFFGQWLAVKYLALIWLIYVVFKGIDKLAVEPGLEKLKKKIAQWTKRRRSRR